MKKRCKTLLTLLVSIMLGSTCANASEVERTTDSTWKTWPVVGQATLSWLWLDIYASQLRSPNGEYNQLPDVSPHPIALEIRYLRDITRQQLIDATIDQWQKLGVDTAQRQQWSVNLAEIFPDVSTGDRLVYVSNGKSGEFFFSRAQQVERSVGRIDDEAFNDAFLSIWLSPKTEYSALRNQLIGMNRP